jgi:hypothetical protein
MARLQLVEVNDVGAFQTPRCTVSLSCRGARQQRPQHDADVDAVVEIERDAEEL